MWPPPRGYDAVYLGLTMALGAQLAALDRGLRSAARMAGVRLLDPGKRAL